jgi:hypothetical protein
MWQELVAPHFTMLLVVEMLSVVKYVLLVRILFKCWANSFNCVLIRICSLQLLIARGACITVLSTYSLLLHRWTPLMVARSWQRNSIEEILSKEPEGRIRTLPSPYLCLPLMSIMNIAR